VKKTNQGTTVSKIVIDNQEYELESNQLAAGIWPCVATSATCGEDKGVLRARINVQFTEGPNKGRPATYEDEINARSALYVARSCKAVGWKGKVAQTLAADVEAWIKETGGATTAEVKHIPIKQGKRAGKIWDKVNSIGRGPKPLAAPSASVLNDANDALIAAMAADSGASSEDDDSKIPF
jgi:hypothetical protein